MTTLWTPGVVARRSEDHPFLPLPGGVPARAAGRSPSARQGVRALLKVEAWSAALGEVLLDGAIAAAALRSASTTNASGADTDREERRRDLGLAESAFRALMRGRSKRPLNYRYRPT